MTPDEAAAILQVSANASIEDIQRAYRHRARLSHPDLFAGHPAPDVAAAANAFVQAARARELLLKATVARDQPDSTTSAASAASAANGADRRADVPDDRVRYVYRPEATSADVPDSTGAVRRQTWWVFGAWTGLLVVGIVISYLGGPLPDSVPDLLLRLIPLAVAATSFALTGRRFWFLATGIFLAISAVMTFVLASFGSLLALQFLLVPVIGLGALGRVRMRRRLRGRV